MTNKRITVMVGLFVGIGSIMIFVLTILFGQESSLFEETTQLYIAFEDVGGLKRGSQVRLAGMTVGIVRGIEFGHTLADKKLHIELQVRTSMMPRIRNDSVATIATKGLLGDKVIELSIGSLEEFELKAGDYIKSEEPTDMFKILEEGGALISHGADVAKDIKVAIRNFTADGTIENTKKIIKSLKNVIEEVETGDGVVHGLVYDKQVQADLRVIMRNVRKASSTINLAVEHVENILREVKEGKGTLHGLIYEADGKKIVDNLREASQTIAEVVSAIRDGKGMLHTLIYEEDTGNIISNLNEATEDIKKLTAYIEAGRGTIGGLIKDPTVFEDLKLILGNLKRNNALKSLIRMSLEQGEEQGLSSGPLPVEGDAPDSLQPASRPPAAEPPQSEDSQAESGESKE